MEHKFVEEQQTAALEPYLCRQWKKTNGNCSYGAECKFLHPALDLTLDDQVPRKERSKNSSGKAKRIRKKNRHRNKIFCYWLANEFGVDTLNHGKGVLDVAGGQGEVSFILRNVFGINATIIDPRDQIDYSKFISKLQAGNYADHSDPSQSPHENSDVLFSLPHHVKLFFTPTLWECVLQSHDTCLVNNHTKEFANFCSRRTEPDFDNMNHFAELLQSAADCWNPETLLQKEKNPSDELVSFSPAEVQEQMALIEDLLTNCSCIIGMHPDQATEPIVDFALWSGKPFAIIPCCVCSKEFPRRCENGKTVRNHQELVEHILLKNDNIQRLDLPFEGKKTVLYWKPSNE